MSDDPIAEPVPQYTEMACGWELLDDLRGGNKRMRERAELWLPKKPDESDERYRYRLKSSFCRPAYKRAVNALGSKPFTKPVNVANAPPRLEVIAKNADRHGATLTMFAHRAQEDLVHRGITHILVDYPPAGSATNPLNEVALDVRPYFTHVTAKALIGWRSMRDRTNREIVTQIRIKEDVWRDKGDYGQERISKIRVINSGFAATDEAPAVPGSFEIWEKGPDEARHKMVASGTTTFTPGQIPLVTVRLKEGPLNVAEPPLEELAWLNLRHWQSQSDQDNILGFARVPIIYETGVSDEDAEKKLRIGAGVTRRVSNTDADMKYVEHSGAAIKAGSEQLADIEEDMTALGLEPEINAPGAETATGEMIDASNANSELQAWVNALEIGLERAYELAAGLIGETLPSNFSVDILSDFTLPYRNQSELAALQASRINGDISQRTILGEFKRRKVLPQNFEVDEEISATQDAGPPLGRIQPPGSPAPVPPGNNRGG